MIKTFVLSLVLHISIAAFAGTQYYPGMVHLVTDTYVSTGPKDDLSKQESNTIVFSFYRNPGDSAAARELSFYFDWSRTPRKIRIWEDDHDTWLSPMSMDSFGDYNIYLTCRSRQGDWLEVIVNEKTKETLWLKNTFFVQLLSWSKLGRGNRWMIITTKTTIYEKRDTSSAKVDPKVNCFQIDKVKGDWMQLSTQDSELCDCYDQGTQKNIWIRFRTPEALFIDVKVL